MQLSYVIRKFTAVYKSIKSRENLYHFINLNEKQVFAKKKKVPDTLKKKTIRIYNQDIRIELCSEKCAMFKIN